MYRKEELPHPSVSDRSSALCVADDCFLLQSVVSMLVNQIIDIIDVTAVMVTGGDIHDLEYMTGEIVYRHREITGIRKEI